MFNVYPSFLGTGNIFLSKSNNYKVSYSSYVEDKKFLKFIDFNGESNFIDKFFNPKLNKFDNLKLIEFKFFLSEMMNTKVDRTSMANSVEVRSPFMDHLLVEYILSLNNNFYQKNKTKHILKTNLKNDFSHNFINREKKGFNIDFENIVFENINFIFDTINDSKISNYISLKNLNLLKIHKSRINSERIYKLLILSNFTK